ncbi:hypothetical protein HI914_03032 [Erysiphe necator]|nr:hypothetical protein HI914_03032 [Erysiphe necator]
MVPQEIATSSTTALFSIQNNHPQFYKNIVTKLSANYVNELPEQESSDDIEPRYDGWVLPKENPEKLTRYPRIVSDGIGPFLGKFKDPASAKD